MIYSKLKGIMRQRGYSQQLLANEMGMTVQSINAKLNGRTQFTIEEALNIIFILDIKNPEEIFFKDNISNMQRKIV